MNRPRKIFVGQDWVVLPHSGWRSKLVWRLFNLKRGPKHRFISMGLYEDNCFMIVISASDGEIIAQTSIENEAAMKSLIAQMEFAIAHKMLVEQ